MIIFHVIASFVESMLLVITNTYYFGGHQKLRIISLIILGFIGALFFDLFLHHYDYLMLYYLFLLILGTPIEKEKSILSMILIPVMLIIVLIFCEAISSIIVNYELVAFYSINSFSKIFSQILYSIFCFLFCFFNDRGYTQSSVKQWWMFIFFVLMILLLFLTIIYYFILHTYSEIIMYMMIAELFVIGFICLMIYRQMKKESEDKLRLQLETQKQKHSQYMMDMTKHMNNRLENDKHRMIYVLMKVKKMIETKNSHTTNYIDQEIEYLTDYHTLTLTNNPLFDSELTKLIHRLERMGYDVKTVLMLKENEILLDAQIVSILMETIEMIASCQPIDKRLNIDIQQKKNYLVFKICIRTNQDENKIDLKKLHQIEYIKKVDISKTSDYCTLSILLSN